MRDGFTTDYPAWVTEVPSMDFMEFAALPEDHAFAPQGEGGVAVAAPSKLDRHYTKESDHVWDLGYEGRFETDEQGNPTGLWRGEMGKELPEDFFEDKFHSARERHRGWSLRWMKRRDMAEVLALEAEAHEAGLVTYPWSDEDYVSHLRKRNCIGLVVEDNDVVIGAVVYELYTDHIVIKSLVVPPGSDMEDTVAVILAKLFSKLGSRRRLAVYFDTSELNRSHYLSILGKYFMAPRYIPPEHGKEHGFIRFTFRDIQAALEGRRRNEDD